MLYLQLMPQYFGLDGAVTGFARKGSTWRKAKFRSERNTAIKGNLLIRVFQFVGEASVLRHIPSDRRIEAKALRFNRLAKALCILVKTDQPYAYVFVVAQQGLYVAFKASQVPASSSKTHVAFGFEFGPFGHYVNGATRLTPAEQCRARPLQYLNGLYADNISRATKTTTRIKAINQKAAGQVDVTRETAH